MLHPYISQHIQKHWKHLLKDLPCTLDSRLQKHLHMQVMMFTRGADEQHSIPKVPENHLNTPLKGTFGINFSVENMQPEAVLTFA